MARYTGPRRRVQRALGTTLSGLTRKTAEERPYPPGQHGPAKGMRRKRPTQYALQLREKQKLRYYYGLRESQLRNYARVAGRRGGPTGEALLGLLERRLDNVVFRLGLAPTIPAARQLVAHRHILVNDRATSVPAYSLRVGDRIAVHARSREHPAIKGSIEHGPELLVPGYLEVADDRYGGRVTAEPQRSDVPIDLQESLVVEYYAR